jgi:hypothetical protein
MRPLPDEWRDEFARLRAERDAASRSVSALQQSLDQLTRLVAGQNERLDQWVSMLRRREAQVKLQEAEIRKLRRKLGMDDPDPDAPSTGTPPPGGSDPTNHESPATGARFARSEQERHQPGPRQRRAPVSNTDEWRSKWDDGSRTPPAIPWRPPSAARTPRRGM